MATETLFNHNDFVNQNIEKYRRERITDAIDQLRVKMYKVKTNEDVMAQALSLARRRVVGYEKYWSGKPDAEEAIRFINAAHAAINRIENEYIENGWVGRVLYQIGTVAGNVIVYFRKLFT